MTLTGDPSPLVLAQRYRIEERIGAGSMGTVWLATDQLLGRAVAVKQLLLQPGSPGFDIRGYEEAKQRILREGRLAARLQHPHTISVFDVVLHDDAPWLVMEYLPSRTFGALLDAEGPIDPLRAAGIGTQIADGLAAAHAAGIVHRDIKPGNVLIGADGKVKITDFGVSRAVDDVQLTRTGMIAGTPAFLAPEIARGRTPTSASDVFALGSTLYAAVEGLPPFGLDDNAYALLYAVGEGKVTPPAKAGPLVEPLMRMLRKEPTERPSAAEVRDELAAVAAGHLVSDPAASSAAPLSLVSAVKVDQDEAPRAARVNAPTRVDVSPLPPVTPASAPLSAPPSAPPRQPTAGPLRGPVLIGVAVAVVAVLLVTAVVVLLYGRGGGTTAASPGAHSSAAPTRAPASGQPTPAELADFVTDYYKLLPGNPQAAWQMLGPHAQAVSGGYDRYQGFYDSLAAVSIVGQPYAVPGSSTVQATLQFLLKAGGPRSPERYSFVVVPGADGKLLIESFSHR
jgi:serine/threonine protein kinase